MKKGLTLVYLALHLLLCLFQAPAYGESWMIRHGKSMTEEADEASVHWESPEERHTIVPTDVTEIDLRTVLGDGAQHVKNVWMLQDNRCIILQTRYVEEEGFEHTIVFWDVEHRSILSQASVSRAEYQTWPGWDDGAFYLLFALEQDTSSGTGPSEYRYKRASISLDGMVSVDDDMPDRLTMMPGGKTAIRDGADGGLYAVDIATGKEQLLLFGISVADMFAAGFNTIAEYVPFWDEYRDDEYPYDLVDMNIYFVRDFYVYAPLDEHRFVYGVNGWEWGVGYGVYDLRTRTDHRITGRDYFFGIGGDWLFGEALMADANTYETFPVAASVQEQFGWVMAQENGHVAYNISPDGRLLALTGMKSRREDASTVTITDLQTGDALIDYNIDNPFAYEYSVDFYDDTHLMLFCRPQEHGSAYLYLFDLTEILSTLV